MPYRDRSGDELFSAVKAGDLNALLVIVDRNWVMLCDDILKNGIRGDKLVNKIGKDVITELWLTKESIRNTDLNNYLNCAVEKKVFAVYLNSRTIPEILLNHLKFV